MIKYFMQHWVDFKEAEVTLNGDNCLFGQTWIKFMENVIDHDRIHPDPVKVEAIVKLNPPTNIAQLRRFMGMANQLGKFSHNSQKCRNHYENYSAQKSLAMGTRAGECFCINQGVDPTNSSSSLQAFSMTKVSAGASSSGLGAALVWQSQDS